MTIAGVRRIGLGLTIRTESGFPMELESETE